jgi:hypothetical protein
MLRSLCSRKNRATTSSQIFPRKNSGTAAFQDGQNLVLPHWFVEILSQLDNRHSTIYLDMRAIEAAGIALAAVQSRAIARRIVVPGTFVPHGDRIVGPPFELHQARLINLGASTGIGFTSGFFCLTALLARAAI